MKSIKIKENNYEHGILPAELPGLWPACGGACNAQIGIGQDHEGQGDQAEMLGMQYGFGLEVGGMPDCRLSAVAGAACQATQKKMKCKWDYNQRRTDDCIDKQAETVMPYGRQRWKVRGPYGRRNDIGRRRRKIMDLQEQMDSGNLEVYGREIIPINR